jgi:hypothetical protein
MAPAGLDGVPAALGQPDQPGPPVVGIGLPPHVAPPLEVRDRLRRRLLRHPEPLGERADRPCPADEVLEDHAVGEPQVSHPVGPDPPLHLVHPIWEAAGDGLVGWVTSRPTPLRGAHLAATPFVSCSYWDPAHDIAVAECAAAWVEDPDTKAHAWEVFRAVRPPAGHDRATIWPDGPDDPGAAVIRLDPWRLKVADAATLAGGGAPLTWRRP